MNYTEPGLSTTMAVEAKQLSSVTLLIWGMVDSCEVLLHASSHLDSQNPRCRRSPVVPL